MAIQKVLIFTRFPRLGRVKTRMAPHLSSESCCELHSALLLDTIDRINLPEVEKHLFMGDCSGEELNSFVESHSLELTAARLQKGADLGQRMWNGYLESEGPGNTVLFVGTDSPSVPLQNLRLAFELLKEVPVVIGPVPDGGYYLLGLAEPRPDLLDGITWGSEQVVSETTQKMSRNEYRFLPEWYDVDRGEDLVRLAADLCSDFEGFPARTRAFLDSYQSKDRDG